MEKQKFLRAAGLGLLLLTVSLWIFVSHSPWFTLSDSDTRVIEGFIEWFGVLYGLLLALLMVEVWTNYNQVGEEIDKEADALRMLYWTAQHLQDQEIARCIARSTLEYADLALQTFPKKDATSEHTNWPNRLKGLFEELVLPKKHEGNGKECVNGGNPTGAEKTFRNLHGFVGQAIASPGHLAVCTEMLARINEARDTHGDWVARAREDRVPDMLWKLLAASSFIWLLAFLGLPIKNFVVGLLFVGGVAFVVAGILFLMYDLSKPLTRSIVASFGPFEDLVRGLKEELGQE